MADIDVSFVAPERSGERYRGRRGSFPALGLSFFSIGSFLVDASVREAVTDLRILSCGV
jgi:hypothetical protein